MVPDLALPAPWGEALLNVCDWCGSSLEGKRVDAETCSQSCRQARHRARIPRCTLPAGETPLSFAYADPPYPGKAHYYRADPAFAGEVDIPDLLSRLATYDGWALSTSAAALPDVLAASREAGAAIRVAAWFRRARPHATARVLNAWEPVVFAGGRKSVAPDRSDASRLAAGKVPLQVLDALVGVTSRRRPTLPGNCLGMKPPRFCEWVFKLLGGLPGDRLDDLFPGSGIVARAWRDYTGSMPARSPHDGSTPDGSTRRL